MSPTTGSVWCAAFLATRLGTGFAVEPSPSQAVERPPLHEPSDPLRVAALTTVYHHNSHADMFLSRVLLGNNLDGTGEFPGMKLVSLFVEQRPPKDIGIRLARDHGVPVCPDPATALSSATAAGPLDGIFVVAEHGDYRESDTGQIMYPKRKWFEMIAARCRQDGRTFPVFLDKGLESRWQDAFWIYSEAVRLGIPLMAGSTLPITWRYPARDVDRGARVDEICVLSYGRLDTYGFHALEILQALAERRDGGEQGVRRVRTLAGDAVWQAIEDGAVDRTLVEQVLSRPEGRPLRRDKPLRDIARQPFLFLVEYRDGLRGSVVTLRDRYPDWTAAWRYADRRTEAAVFWTQEARPLMHFSHMTGHIERFFRTRRSPWPLERTLLTSGMLDALLISNRDGGIWVDTPHLAIRYGSSWDWSQPPPPPPGRPLAGQ